jgi:hypothetical protein
VFQSGKTSLANSLRSNWSLCGSVPQDNRTIGIERSVMKLHEPSQRLVKEYLIVKDGNEYEVGAHEDFFDITTLKLSPSQHPNCSYHKVYRDDGGRCFFKKPVGAIQQGVVITIIADSIKIMTKPSTREHKIIAKLDPKHYADLKTDTLGCVPGLFQEHNPDTEGFVEIFDSDRVLSSVAIDVNMWDLAGQQSYLLSNIMHFSKRSVYVVMWKPDLAGKSSVDEGFLKKLLLWFESLAIAVPDASIFLVGSHCKLLPDQIFNDQAERIFKAINDRVLSYNTTLFPLEANTIDEQRKKAKDQIKKDEEIVCDLCSRNCTAQNRKKFVKPSDIKGWQSLLEENSWPRSLKLKVDALIREKMHLESLETRLRLLCGIPVDSQISDKEKLPKTVIMKLYPCNIDNLRGFGVDILRDKIFEVCSELPFMKELIPKNWSTMVKALENASVDGGILSKDDAIAAATNCDSHMNAQKMHKYAIWSAIQFYSDVGRIFVRDEVVLLDPGRLIALLNPLVHHEPGTLLTRADFQQSNYINENSLKDHKLREDLGALLHALKKQDTFSLKFLTHLKTWPRDLDHQKSFLSFFEECNIVSPISRDQMLVTSRVKGRETLTSDDIQAIDANQRKSKSKYHVFYLMPIAHPGLIASMLSQIIKLNIPYLHHQSGNNTILLEKKYLSSFDHCIISIEDVYDLTKIGAFCSLQQNQQIDESVSYCALYIRSSDFGLFHFASQVADSTLDSGKFSTICLCYGACGEFPLFSSSIEKARVFQKLRLKLEASVQDLKILEGVVGNFHDELESLRANIDASWNRQTENEAFTVSTTQTEISARSLFSGSAIAAGSSDHRWIRFRSLNSSTPDSTPCSLSAAYNNPKDNRVFDEIHGIPPQYPLLILRAYDDVIGEFLCQLKYYSEQRSLMGVWMDPHSTKPNTETMQVALSKAKTVFVALTPTYLTQSHCLNELMWALDLEDQGYLSSLKIMSLHPALTSERLPQLIECGSVYVRKLNQVVQLSEFAVKLLKRLRNKNNLLSFENFVAWRRSEQNGDWDDATHESLQQNVKNVFEAIYREGAVPLSAGQRKFEKLDSDSAELMFNRNVQDPNFYFLFPECPESINFTNMKRDPDSSLAVITKLGFHFSRLNILHQMGLNTVGDIRDYIELCEQNAVRKFELFAKSIGR